MKHAVSLTFILFVTSLVGCAGLNDPYSTGGNGGYGYGNRGGYYDRRDDYYWERRERDRIRDERRDLEDERDKLERERKRLERERDRDRDKNKWQQAPSPEVHSKPKPERCPSGWRPGRCSSKDRKKGCKDMRMPGGLGCRSR